MDPEKQVSALLTMCLLLARRGVLIMLNAFIRRRLHPWVGKHQVGPSKRAAKQRRRQAARVDLPLESKHRRSDEGLGSGLTMERRRKR